MSPEQLITKKYKRYFVLGVEQVGGVGGNIGTDVCSLYVDIFTLPLPQLSDQNNVNTVNNFNS